MHRRAPYGRRVPEKTDDVRVLARAVLALDVPSPRPVIVGISGFGGAGKSTLADAVARELPGCLVVAGDEFLLERPPTRRSDNWDVVDRDRLRAQVLKETGVSHLVVEGLGLFVPELVGLFDLRVWLEVDLETATAQGMWRDEHVYDNPQTEFWLDVWKPNDADFFRRHRPDLAADIVFTPPDR